MKCPHRYNTYRMCDIGSVPDWNNTCSGTDRIILEVPVWNFQYVLVPVLYLKGSWMRNGVLPSHLCQLHANVAGVDFSLGAKHKGRSRKKGRRRTHSAILPSPGGGSSLTARQRREGERERESDPLVARSRDHAQEALALRAFFPGSSTGSPCY